MIHNVNCSKKSQMKKPEDLIRLPHDNIKKQQKPKSTRESFEKFMKQIERNKNKDSLKEKS